MAAATAAGVGLVQVAADGTVTWSDEAYRLHGRPRWVRVRSLDFDQTTEFSLDFITRDIAAPWSNYGIFSPSAT